MSLFFFSRLYSLVLQILACIERKTLRCFLTADIPVACKYTVSISYMISCPYRMDLDLDLVELVNIMLYIVQVFVFDYRMISYNETCQVSSKVYSSVSCS
ncbi:hypothetical protein F4774DRAFT_385336 [Daldinia eschscholtzii]|nr:hypothetical protein F4774DRAFT_385336 [Daldinia eschscholtzii]